MPADMTEAELEKARAGAREVDAFDYRNDDDEDDYISAILYEASGGRHFRLVESSGMNSMYSGAGDFGEWLTQAEVATWSKF